MLKINKFLLFSMAVLSLKACAMGSKNPNYKKAQVIRSEASSAWIRCEMNPGYFCNTYCPKGKLKRNGECKKKLVIRKKNFCDPDNAAFFKDMILFNRNLM